MGSRVLSPLWGSRGCHHHGALGCCHHHGALGGGGGGAVTIMELSGDVNADTGLLDMISKLFIMN